MTNKEISDIIKKSISFKFLNNLEIELNFEHINLSFKFNGFLELYTFVKRQNKGWSKIEIELPNVLKESKQYFNSFFEDLIECAKSDDAESNWNSIEESYINISRYEHFYNKNIFTFDSPVTSLFIELFKVSKESFIGAYDYIYGNIDNYKFSNKDYLIGINKAYEFDQLSPEKILKRNRYEKSNLSRLRNDFESFIVKSNKTVLNLLDEIENLKKNKNKDFETWFNKIKEQEKKRFNETKKNDIEYSEYSIKRSKELEELYSDKLMLSKPAEYWNERAVELKSESKKWLILLLVSTSISIIILMTLIIKISNDTLIKLFSNTGSAIRWSILLIAIISFLAFAIRLFSKLTLSSYHLARDAEERKQLVYVYLSLKNQKSISENERILILQSIFSRSDTGLLKEDSSPTMPTTGIIDKILNK